MSLWQQIADQSPEAIRIINELHPELKESIPDFLNNVLPRYKMIEDHPLVKPLVQISSTSYIVFVFYLSLLYSYYPTYFTYALLTLVFYTAAFLPFYAWATIPFSIPILVTEIILAYCFGSSSTSYYVFLG